MRVVALFVVVAFLLLVSPGLVLAQDSSASEEASPITTIFWVAVAFFALVAFIVILTFGKLWLQAAMSGAHVRMYDFVGMVLRKVPVRLIVENRITAVKAGLSISTDKLEAHYLASGRVGKVVRALIAANKAAIPLTFEKATAIDLAGRDVEEAISTSVLPKVIDVPDSRKGKDTLEAVAMDGIQLRVKARVTVRTNIERLVGGATEETIIARVGEGIVTTVGSSRTYKAVLENPDSISKTVLSKSLDSGTAFEILSIDIADIDVGDNIGARLQADQAEADKRVAQAKAEERRALAIAREQEMKALTQENRAKVVLAEAEIPMAIAHAFKSGHLGVMDYYNLRNVQADTDMRTKIGDAGK
ncbi:MAG: flotillin-like protein FloA [Planctomycetota bacterium]|nr:flotillin-like protein FloA [Planctomycetota bacterium]